MSDLPSPETGASQIHRPAWEVAGLPAPPYAQEDFLLPRQWLREVREVRGLSKWAVVQRVTAHTPKQPFRLSRLEHLEVGRLSLSNVEACHMEGLRLVLDVPVSIWQKVFGNPP